jgi:MtN3 and saliva related transmembrane protein
MFKFKSYYEHYMNVIGPIGNLMFYFQFYKIFDEKSSASVSLTGFSISVIAMTSWLLYGILLKNKPLIIANLVGAIGAILVTVAILIY